MFQAGFQEDGSRCCRQGPEYVDYFPEDGIADVLGEKLHVVFTELIAGEKQVFRWWGFSQQFADGDTNPAQIFSRVSIRGPLARCVLFKISSTVGPGKPMFRANS